MLRFPDVCISETCLVSRTQLSFFELQYPCAASKEAAKDNSLTTSIIICPTFCVYYKCCKCLCQTGTDETRMEKNETNPEEHPPGYRFVPEDENW